MCYRKQPGPGPEVEPGVQRHRYCRLHVLAHPTRRVLKESTQLRRWGGDPRIKGSEYTQIAVPRKKSGRNSVQESGRNGVQESGRNSVQESERNSVQESGRNSVQESEKK